MFLWQEEAYVFQHHAGENIHFSRKMNAGKRGSLKTFSSMLLFGWDSMKILQ